MFNYFYKRGFVDFDLPSTVLQNLKQYFEKCVANNFHGLLSVNKSLVGVINDEYHLGESQAALIFPFVEQAAMEYYKAYNPSSNLKVGYNRLDQIVENSENKPDTWVNFQKKGEFNPPHNHIGDLSFVIWINIPYDIPKQIKLFKEKGAREVEINTPGAFYILTPDHFSRSGIQVNVLNVDKTFEGRGIVFESGTMHMVSPFFESDGYRISIAGNLRLVDADNNYNV